MEDAVVEQLIRILPASESFGEAYNKLVKAFKDCDVDILNKYLELGFNPNVLLFDGHSPLTLLIDTSTSSKWAVAAKLLLERGCSPNSRNPKGTPVLSLLVAAGEPELVRMALDNGAVTEAKGHSNETALLTAVHYKKFDCLKVLLERGANPNVVSKDGNSALMWAAGRSNGIGSPKCLATVKALLSYGADPNTCNNRGYTPLMAAALIREAETVRTLISVGAELEAADFSGETALFKAVHSNSLETVRILINAGADVKAISKQKQTLLMIANTYEILNYLIKQGCDVNAQDSEGLTALHFYVAENRVQFIRLLLLSGAHLETRCNMGNTALQLAVRARSYKCIDLLLNKGASSTTKNNDGITLFHEIVVPWDFFKTINIFEVTNTASLLREVQSYLLPASATNCSLLRKLLEQGGHCDVESQGAGVTPLMLAALGADFDICKLLVVEGGADPHAVDHRGRSVLSYACRGGNLRVVKLLLQRDVLVNNVDDDDSLPIFYAAHFCYDDIVLELMVDYVIFAAKR